MAREAERVDAERALYRLAIGEEVNQMLREVGAPHSALGAVNALVYKVIRYGGLRELVLQDIERSAALPDLRVVVGRAKTLVEDVDTLNITITRIDSKHSGGIWMDQVVFHRSIPLLKEPE